MAIGVNSSGWKPRKIVGTPAGKFTTYVGVGLLSFGLLYGTIFHLSKFTFNLRKASETVYEDPIEEIERRILIGSGLPNRSGDIIRRNIEEDSRPDLPYK